MTQPSSLCYLYSPADRTEVKSIQSVEKPRSAVTLIMTGSAVMIRAPPPSADYLGFVSDRSLLSWFARTAKQTPSLQSFLSNSLTSLNLPSLYLYAAVVAASAADTMLDAMKLMSDEGVSSVAVLEEENGALLSAISVTDVGKVSS